MKHSIRLIGFQGHSDSSIELAPTITAITGKTNHGKTSIVRAVKFVKDNRPVGNKFIKNGWDSTAVTIDTVTHEKSKTVDQYKIEGHKDPFKALRGAVPEEVTKALNLGPENIQEQLDPVFLLNESSGKVAQKLSELSDLDVTVSALQYISSKRRGIKSDMDVLNKSIVVAEAQLHDLRHTDSMDTDLALLESELASINVLRVAHDNLYEKYKNAVKALSELNSIPSDAALKPAKRIVQQYDEAAAENKRIASVSRIIAKAVSLQEELECDPSALLRKANRVEKAITSHLKVQGLLGKAAKLRDSIKSINDSIAKKEARKTELMGDTCPLCGK